MRLLYNYLFRLKLFYKTAIESQKFWVSEYLFLHSIKFVSAVDAIPSDSYALRAGYANANALTDIFN